MTKNNIPPLVQSTISHYVAIRDKALAELDICFNHNSNLNIGEELTDKVNELFKTLNESNGILQTIEATLKIEESNKTVVENPNEKTKS